MKINFGSPFKGTLPKLSRSLLPEGFAVNADNCKLFSGEIRAYGGTSLIKSPNPGAAPLNEILSIYLYDDAYWLNWIEHVRAAPGPIADDTRKRLYWMGDGAYPKKGDFDTITNLGDSTGPLPNGSYKLGVPTPTTLPSLVETTPGGSSLLEDRAYVYTHVSAWGEESAPSPPSIITNIAVDSTVTLSSMDGDPGSPYNVTGGNLRVYRTKFGAAGQVNPYLFVKEIAIGTTSTLDDVAADDLGAVIPSFFIDAATGAIVTWDEPPDDIEGLTTFPGGVFVGFVGPTLYFSEPEQPHAWPAAYARVLEYDIIAVGVVANMLVVATKGFPYVFAGAHPLLLSRDRLPVSQPCVSARSLVEFRQGVAYASPDGFFLIGPGRTELITKSATSRDEWQAFEPESMHAVVHDQRVHIFYRTPGGIEQALIIDPSAGVEGFLIPSTVYSTTALSDVATDILYLVDSGNIVQWDNDQNNRLQFNWRSRTRETPPWSPGGAAVLADYDGGLTEDEIASFQATRVLVVAANTLVFASALGPGAVNGEAMNGFELNGDGTQSLPPIPSNSLQFVYYGDGTALFTRIVTSEEPFPLGDDNPAVRRHEVQVIGDLPVRDVRIGGSKSELG